ncbi:amidohydrolase [Flexivirga caeni]|uniref:Amidohydrolase n=1 Tax=Flexivirga caeni TaxID=2294115 RepID=A0A3M9M7W8_9MICO|nr:amidohydrolase [Flexivirga caeni]RNI21315.1 amidohydrolase [Flexivirga caeni]
MTSLAADLILYGGHVRTGLRDQLHQAVAVLNGRIVAVGTNAQLHELRGPHTVSLDLRDRLVLPGFQDAHIHPVEGGLTRQQCDLHEQATAPEYLAAICEYARSHPAAPWIVGGGWSMDAFPGGVPHRSPLDAVVQDRPVFLPNRDGHSTWVNSRALELAGIDERTPDPPDGRIERDPDGMPTGVLHEGAARLVSGLLPPLTAQDRRAGLLAGQRYLHSLGITGWQDAIVGGDVAEQDSYQTYCDAAASGELTARVVGALWWERSRGLDQLPELIARRDASRIGRFAATSVKLMVDGVLETRTAAMRTPYLQADGSPSADVGMSFLDAETLREIVVEIDAAGLQAHFHAIGDRAVRDALDAVEAARIINGNNDTRPHIAHLQVVHPDDRVRFALTGVAANAQPLWACYEPQMTQLTIPQLGPERAGWQYPFADLHHSGAVLAAGSDWPVSTPNPLEEIHVAVNRRAIDTPCEPAFLPEQALTLHEAVAAFTIGSAHVNHLDQLTGTLQVGKRADFAVLDRDIFTEPADRIGEAVVDLTFVDGDLVFERNVS